MVKHNAWNELSNTKLNELNFPLLCFIWWLGKDWSVMFYECFYHWQLWWLLLSHWHWHKCMFSVCALVYAFSGDCRKLLILCFQKEIGISPAMLLLEYGEWFCLYNCFLVLVVLEECTDMEWDLIILMTVWTWLMCLWLICPFCLIKWCWGLKQ